MKSSSGEMSKYDVGLVKTTLAGKGSGLNQDGHRRQMVMMSTADTGY
jgi:hypothetical protein